MKVQFFPGGIMPQVAARINEEQERWLKDYFRTKSAGAEFILPWAVDTFFRAITGIKHIFSGPELKTIVEAHKDMKLMPDHTRLSYLILRVFRKVILLPEHLVDGEARECQRPSAFVRD